MLALQTRVSVQKIKAMFTRNPLDDNGLNQSARIDESIMHKRVYE